MNATLTTLKTIKIEYTTASIIRCVAHKDIPEIDVKEGSCFYLVRASKNNGEYYICRWNFDLMRWQDTCPATVHNCKHVRSVSTDCKKTHVIFSYKPVAAPIVAEAPCKEVKGDDTDAWFLAQAKAEDARREILFLEGGKAPVAPYNAVVEAEAFIAKAQAEKAAKVTGLAETYNPAWYPKTSI